MSGSTCSQHGNPIQTWMYYIEAVENEIPNVTVGKQSKVAVEKKGTAESYEVERFWTIMGNCTALLMLL